jgi:hypothetical protein
MVPSIHKGGRKHQSTDQTLLCGIRFVLIWRMVRTRRSSLAIPLRVAFCHPDLGLGGAASWQLQGLEAPQDFVTFSYPNRTCDGGLQGQSGSLWMRRWSWRGTATRWGGCCCVLQSTGRGCACAVIVPIGTQPTMPAAARRLLAFLHGAPEPSSLPILTGGCVHRLPRPQPLLRRDGVGPVLCHRCRRLVPAPRVWPRARAVRLRALRAGGSSHCVAELAAWRAVRRGGRGPGVGGELGAARAHHRPHPLLLPLPRPAAGGTALPPARRLPRTAGLGGAGHHRRRAPLPRQQRLHPGCVLGLWGPAATAEAAGACVGRRGKRAGEPAGISRCRPAA